MSFSPRTGLVYIPHQNLCQDIEAMPASYIAGTPFVGAAVVYKAGPGGNRGVVTAWDSGRCQTRLAGARVRTQAANTLTSSRRPCRRDAPRYPLSIPGSMPSGPIGDVSCGSSGCTGTGPPSGGPSTTWSSEPSSGCGPLQIAEISR